MTEQLKELFYIQELIVNGFPAEQSEIDSLGKKKDELTTQIKKVVLRASLDEIGGVYDDLLNDLEEELREVQQKLAQITYREEAIQADHRAFTSYLEYPKSFDIENQRRGLVFDYQFMKMSYFELIEKADNIFHHAAIPSLFLHSTENIEI